MKEEELEALAHKISNAWFTPDKMSFLREALRVQAERTIPIEVLKNRLQEDLMNGNLKLELNVSIEEFINVFIRICNEEKFLKVEK